VRFLADENFPGAAVNVLTGEGHDVAWVRTIAPGMPDAEVFAWAVRESRVILTFDKDFGEIARGAGLSATCGAVLFRLPMTMPSDVGEHLASLITARSDWAGHFSVIEPDRVRMRPLPTR
jgi:predicted nuclease of predicted toxin-antitoxin system